MTSAATTVFDLALSIEKASTVSVVPVAITTTKGSILEFDISLGTSPMMMTMMMMTTESESSL